MAIQRLVIAPWVEPSKVIAARFQPTMGEETSNAWWQDYFVEGSWQRNSPKVLETPKGILIFKNWEQLSDTRWKIYPLTILIPQEGANASIETIEPVVERAIDLAANSSNPVPTRRAIFVENPQGAEIQFREALDLASGKPPPPVVGGQLNGPIRIYAPPRATGEDELLIDTRDLRIDRKMITTTQNVTMKIGRSRIEGRDLSIHLDNTLLSPGDRATNKESSPFEGLDFLELIYVDRVDIDLPPGGLFNNTNDSIPKASKLSAKAEVLCENAFRFDFHNSLATLSGNVRLRHIVAGLPEDLFKSDLLNLHFKWAGEWSIDTIEAMGANGVGAEDPSRWVQLDAPNLKARGQGRWFKLDMNLGRVAIANHLPAMPATDSSQVYLQQDTMQVWSPEIEYESEMLSRQAIQAKDNAMVGLTSEQRKAENASKPMRLGKLWAAGPGQALLASESDDQWRLSWAESLQLQPEEEYERLSIVGSANARSETQGRFSAEKVDILMSSLAKDVVTEMASAQAGRKPASVIPRWLHATGKTIVDSPQLRAQVSDMQIWFAYPDIEAMQTLLKNESAEAKYARLERNRKRPEPMESRTATSAIGTAFSGLTDVASSVGGGSGSASSNTNPQNSNLPVGQLRSLNSPAPEFPMNVTGETLIANISNSQLGMVIDDLLLSGIVTVTRDQISDDSALPLTIEGSQLRIDTSDGGLFDATIIGEPAKLSVGDASLSGPEVRSINAAKRFGSIILESLSFLHRRLLTMGQ